MKIRKLLAISFGYKIAVLTLCVLILAVRYIFGIWFDMTHSVSSIKDTLKTIKNVDERDEQGLTGLMVAVNRGNLELVKAFIEAGADVNAVTNDKYRNSVLELAVFNGDLPNHDEMVYELVKNGANVRYQDVKGNTALSYIDEFDLLDKRTDLTRFFIKHGSDINLQNNYGYTLLHIAVSRYLFYWVRAMIKNFSSLIDFSIKNYDGKTALDLAKERYFSDIVVLFEDIPPQVGIDGDFRARDPNGFTGLMIAVIRNQFELAQKLLDLGAKINEYSDDKYGYTPLHLGVLFQNPQMVDFLLERNANRFQRDKLGDTPLHLVARISILKTQVKILDRLLKDLTAQERSRLLNQKNSDGNTLLHLIANINGTLFMEYLIKNYGKDINQRITNKDGLTPYGIAEKKKYTDLFPLFKELSKIQGT